MKYMFLISSLLIVACISAENKNDDRQIYELIYNDITSCRNDIELDSAQWVMSIYFDDDLYTVEEEFDLLNDTISKITTPQNNAKKPQISLGNVIDIYANINGKELTHFLSINVNDTIYSFETGDLRTLLLFLDKVEGLLSKSIYDYYMARNFNYNILNFNERFYTYNKNNQRDISTLAFHNQSGRPNVKQAYLTDVIEQLTSIINNDSIPIDDIINYILIDRCVQNYSEGEFTSIRNSTYIVPDTIKLVGSSSLQTNIALKFFKIISADNTKDIDDYLLISYNGRYFLCYRSACETWGGLLYFLNEKYFISNLNITEIAKQIFKKNKFKMIEHNNLFYTEDLYHKLFIKND